MLEKSNLIPLGEYLIVTPAKEELTKTTGGLLMTEKQGEVRYRRATILSVGKNIDFLKPDDVIYYDRHAGQILEHDGNDYTIIRLRDVVVIV